MRCVVLLRDTEGMPQQCKRNNTHTHTPPKKQLQYNNVRRIYSKKQSRKKRVYQVSLNTFLSFLFSSNETKSLEDSKISLFSLKTITCRSPGLSLPETYFGRSQDTSVGHTPHPEVAKGSKKSPLPGRLFVVLEPLKVRTQVFFFRLFLFLSSLAFKNVSWYCTRSRHTKYKGEQSLQGYQSNVASSTIHEIIPREIYI